MSKSFFLLLLMTMSVISCFSQEIKEELSDYFQNSDYKNASIGIHVLDLKTGETLYARNSEKLLIPASTLKLVTSASALEMLGAEYQFTTQIAYTGETNRNLLKGNLVVIGGADPTLGSEYFQEHYNDFLKNWAKRIKAAGILKIEGDLVLDASLYDSEEVPPTWIWEDIGNYYGAGANAFTVYDNLFRITFESPKRAGRQTKIISTYPQIEQVEITNKVVSANDNSDNAYVFGSPIDETRIIRGTIPKNRRAFTIKAAIHDPAQLLAKELIRALAKEGVFLSGEIRFEKVNQKDIRTVFIQKSPKLAKIVKVLNYESVNLFAEHLLKQISAEKDGFGNRQESIKLLMEYWESKGFSTRSVFMEDGSGLSHFNAVSPSFFTGFLNHMAQNEAFLNSLPGAGDGTLSRFNKNLFPENTIKAKSGSMTRVRCYSGYLKLDSEKTAAFSIMVNHFSGSHSKLIEEIEKLLMKIIQLN